MIKLRFRNSIAIQNAVLQIYYSLSLKNIPLLQEAYRYILRDLENAYKTLMPKMEPLVHDKPLINNEYQKEHAEIVILFLLRALSDIGKKYKFYQYEFFCLKLKKIFSKCK